MKKRLKVVVFTLLGVTLLWLAFKGVDVGKLFDDLKKADFFYIGISMLLGYMAFASRGIRWNYLLETMGYRARVGNSIAAVAGGYLANLGVPRIGELARCTFLNQKENIPVDKLFGTIILERIIDMIMLLICIGLAFILKFSALAEFFTDVLSLRDENGESSNKIYYILGALVFGLLMLYLLRKQIAKLPIFTKLKDFLLGLKEGLTSAFRMKKKWAFLGHTLFIWFAYFLMTYICFFSIEATSDLSMADGLYVLVVGGLGMVVPSQGGIGSYHFAVKIGLVALGVEEDSGLLLATLIHAGQTVMTLFTGGLSLLYIYIKR